MLAALLEAGAGSLQARQRLGAAADAAGHSRERPGITRHGVFASQAVMAFRCSCMPLSLAGKIPAAPARPFACGDFGEARTVQSTSPALGMERK